jgi:hypothetical protein
MTSPFSSLRDSVAQMGLSKPDAYTPYAAGAKMYGIGRDHPQDGSMDSAAAQTGYRQRDLANKAKRSAYLARMQAAQQGNYMSSQYMNPAVQPGVS